MVIAALVLGSVGCSSRSTYIRAEADDEELVWAYDDGLRIVDGRNQPVAQGPRWDGLAARVACVDEAAALAAQAESDGGLGRIFSWTGTGVFVAGLGVSLSLGMFGALLAITAGPGPLVLGGVVAVGGTALFAGIAAGLWAWGGHLTRSALPEAMDAMNLYNDRFLGEEACRPAAQQPGDRASGQRSFEGGAP